MAFLCLHHRKLDILPLLHNRRLLSVLVILIKPCRLSRDISFPEPLRPLVAEEVLVETFEHGEIVRNFVYSSTPYNRLIAQTGLHAFLQMMLQVSCMTLLPTVIVPKTLTLACSWRVEMR
jgi:hypothetical protein